VSGTPVRRGVEPLGVTGPSPSLLGVTGPSPSLLGVTGPSPSLLGVHVEEQQRN